MTKGLGLGLFVFLFGSLLPAAVFAQTQASQLLQSVLPASIPEAGEKITLGEVEDVTLEPWTVTLPARIDTGATLSSLDARDITVHGDVADFSLGKRYGALRLQLPVVDWVYVRSSGGVDKRPVAKLHICLGPRQIQTLVTLRDRSEMAYPFLVGRNILSGLFMVDTSRSRAVPPQCRSHSFPLASSAGLK